MVSSYSTDLKLELMVTGENAGTWGDITNTNLVILQQAIAGYQTVALNATTGATLTFTNGALSCLLYTSPSPRDLSTSRMPSSA